MKTKRVLMLGLIMALLLATFAAGGASAKGAEVPFRAYYPVNAEANFDPSCMCLRQHFEPGGDGQATHMGVSQLYGDADAWQLGEIFIQKGTATLTAANGDYLTVYYE